MVSQQRLKFAKRFAICEHPVESLNPAEGHVAAWSGRAEQIAEGFVLVDVFFFDLRSVSFRCRACSVLKCTYRAASGSPGSCATNAAPRTRSLASCSAFVLASASNLSLLATRSFCRFFVALSGGSSRLVMRKCAVLALSTRPSLEEAAWRVMNATATIASSTLAQEVHTTNLCLPIPGHRSIAVVAFPLFPWRLRTPTRLPSVALAASFAVSVPTGAFGLILALSFLAVALFFPFSHCVHPTSTDGPAHFVTVPM